jgi:hypothetical protein
MSGVARLPGGEVRRPSQRRSRRAARPTTVVPPAVPHLKAGDAIRWKEYHGYFLEPVGGDAALILIGRRKWKVPVNEVLPS